MNPGGEGSLPLAQHRAIPGKVVELTAGIGRDTIEIEEPLEVGMPEEWGLPSRPVEPGKIGMDNCARFKARLRKAPQGEHASAPGVIREVVRQVTLPSEWTTRRAG